MNTSLNLFKNLQLCLIGLLLIIGLSTCKKHCKCKDASNPDCENYDPCYGKSAANADFTINEIIGDYRDKKALLSETDTIIYWNYTLFKPKHQLDKVTWYLGSEVVSQQELVRGYYPSNTWVTVTMIGEQNPSSCLDSTQLKDTVTKRFYVVRYDDTNSYKQSPWWGTWKGYNTDEPNQEITISFGFINKYGEASFAFAGLPIGEPKQRKFYSHSQPSQGGGGPFGYKRSLFIDNGIHQDWGGFAINGILDRNSNEIIFNYRFNNRPYQQWLKGLKQEVEPIEWINKTFKGVKISEKIFTQ